MRPAIKTLALAAATLIVGLASLPSLTGESRPPAIPRLNGKPDVNGIWQTLNTANWDIRDQHRGEDRLRVVLHRAYSPLAK